MATYELQPMPDADRVWWLRPGVEPLMLTRSGDEGYAHDLPNGDRLGFWYWHELLARPGYKVTTDDPDDTSWLYDLGRFPLRAEGDEILDADGRELLAIDGEWASETDARLAALIARLVNEHVARHAEQGGGA